MSNDPKVVCRECGCGLKAIIPGEKIVKSTPSRKGQWKSHEQCYQAKLALIKYFNCDDIPTCLDTVWEHAEYEEDTRQMLEQILADFPHVKQRLQKKKG